MGRIRLDRPEMEAACAKAGTLAAYCESARQIAQGARSTAYGLTFSGKDNLISRLQAIENRLAKQTERIQRLGTLMGAISSELTEADISAGAASQMLWDWMTGDGHGEKGAGLSLSAAAAMGRLGLLAGLFMGGGVDPDDLGTVPLFEKFLAKLFGKKTAGRNGHSGVGYDGKDFYYDRQAVDGSTGFFDDEGSYGGDQGNLAHTKKGVNILGHRYFYDEEVFAYVRKHKGYEYYTDEQIAHLLDRMNEESCGYIAAVNNIYIEFEGREKEFEACFGFPMYDEYGQENYNYLYLDMYLETDDMYYMNEPNGPEALINDTVLVYEGREDAFYAEFGCYPCINGYINPEAAQRILDRFENASVVSLEIKGTHGLSLSNRLQHYLKSKGVSISGEVLSNRVLDPGEIRQYIQNGRNVNISVTKGFTLYDEFGIPVSLAEDHWMTITGTTEQGDYIVSSWGERYYLKPNKLSGANVSYYVTDITVP